MSKSVAKPKGLEGDTAVLAPPKAKKAGKSGSNGNGKLKHQSHTNGNGHTDEGPDVRQLLKVLTEVKNGNFNVRMPQFFLGH